MKMILTALALLCSGLIAGLLFSYSCSVNPGLRALSNIEYLHAMQSINKEIQHAIFLITFIMPLVLLPIGTYFQFPSPNSFYLWIAATLLYVIGVFGVTVFGNVPLNEQLDGSVLEKLNPSDLAKVREQFEVPWIRFHFIRTVAAVFSFFLLLLSLTHSHK